MPRLRPSLPRGAIEAVSQSVEMLCFAVCVYVTVELGLSASAGALCSFTFLPLFLRTANVTGNKSPTVKEGRKKSQSHKLVQPPG